VLDDSTAARLAETMEEAGYTVEGLAERLGPMAHGALLRDETVPALRATIGDDQSATLVRLLSLQQQVSAGAAERALPGLVCALCDGRVLRREGDTVRAVVDVIPDADDERGWWVVSDRAPRRDGGTRRMAADHVLGASAAARSLAGLTWRRPASRALDLGTGSGVQALHLSRHCDRVVATDVNPRALAMARLTARLNGADLDLRAGDLYDPVADEEFDLVVSNPPFVVSSGAGDRLTYRDSELPGDELVARVVRGSQQRLAPDGTAHVLANWVHREGDDWRDRVSGWLGGCDAWVVQREVVDPAQYVELWLRDAGLEGSPDYVGRYDAWLAWLEELRVTGIGMGWVVLRRADRDVPDVRLEEWPYEVEQPLGPEVSRWAARCDRLAGLDDEGMLATAWRRRPDVRQETVGEPGAEHPETIVLRQRQGMRRARQVDTVEAALVGASDGDLTAGRLRGAIGEVLGEDPDREATVGSLRDLVRDGYLE
jgi:methylase of polypeptide subunit release factors